MFEYRLAREEDFEQVLCLFRQLWQNKAIDIKRLRSLFQRAIANPLRRYVLATEGEHIVGLGSVSILDKLWQEGTIAYVEELVVH